MAAKVTFFRVGNGDMALVELDSGKKILIDCNICSAADDPDDDRADVATQLKSKLNIDAEGRPYLDAMLLSHPDLDHCCGLDTHFHMGALSDYPEDEDKIVVREMWSSPVVFRRASNDHVLCDDAKIWAAEARRRVNRYKTSGAFPVNERILILGEDEGGRTDDIEEIVVKTDNVWTEVNGAVDASFEALLLAPILADDEEEEETLTKNNSSVIVRLRLAADGEPDACRFLTGGDAEVAIWEKLWARHEDSAEADLSYDLLLTPHHCSWHSLSWDSWSECGEDAEVSEDARNALGQARDGALLVASSKAISEEDTDPPCTRAEREYKAIADEASGEFVCVGDDGPEPLEVEIEVDGPNLLGQSAPAILTAGLLKRVGERPASRAAVRKEGGGRYA